jgi:hypothetical protein
MPSNRYGDPRTAAFEAEKYYNPWSIEHNLEVGGLIYQRKDGSFGFTGPNSKPKLESHVVPFMLIDPDVLRQVPKDAKLVGDYHTHGDNWTREPFTKSGDENFSPGDKRNSRFAAGNLRATDEVPRFLKNANTNPEWKSYLGTPTGAFKEYDPSRDKVINWGRFPQLMP